MLTVTMPALTGCCELLAALVITVRVVKAVRQP